MIGAMMTFDSIDWPALFTQVTGWTLAAFVSREAQKADINPARLLAATKVSRNELVTFAHSTGDLKPSKSFTKYF